MPRNATKYTKMPRNQKGSTPRKGSVQVQVFSRPRSTMIQQRIPENEEWTGPWLGVLKCLSTTKVLEIIFVINLARGKHGSTMRSSSKPNFHVFGEFLSVALEPQKLWFCFNSLSSPFSLAQKFQIWYKPCHAERNTRLVTSRKSWKHVKTFQAMTKQS